MRHDSEWFRIERPAFDSPACADRGQMFSYALRIATRESPTQVRRNRSIMAASSLAYPIGRPGIPWGEAEREQWLSRQVRHRSYATDVAGALERLSSHFDVTEYGRLDYPPDQY
jgi:hypothetical protein